MQQENNPPQDEPKGQAVPAAQRWRQIIARQRESGLGVMEFCRREGIASSSFFGWRAKLRGGGRARSPARFAAVKVVDRPAAAGSALAVRLRGGRRLIVRRGFDRQLLIEAVRLLEGLA